MSGHPRGGFRDASRAVGESFARDGRLFVDFWTRAARQEGDGARFASAFSGWFHWLCGLGTFRYSSHFSEQEVFGTSGKAKHEHRGVEKFQVCDVQVLVTWASILTLLFKSLHVTQSCWRLRSKMFQH